MIEIWFFCDQHYGRYIAPAAATQDDIKAVGKALADFARSTGIGPSGLRAQHLKETLEPGLREEVLRHLTFVVNLLARSQATKKCKSGCVELLSLLYLSRLGACDQWQLVKW